MKVWEVGTISGTNRSEARSALLIDGLAVPRSRAPGPTPRHAETQTFPFTFFSAGSPLCLASSLPRCAFGLLLCSRFLIVVMRSLRVLAGFLLGLLLCVFVSPEREVYAAYLLGRSKLMAAGAIAYDAAFTQWFIGGRQCARSALSFPAKVLCSHGAAGPRAGWKPTAVRSPGCVRLL